MISAMNNASRAAIFRLRSNPAWPRLGVFLASLVVYLATAPRGVALEDDGFFILAAYFNGIAHPPGYPLHTLLGHLCVQLPFGSVAWRVHALSGIFGALSCALLWSIARRLLKDDLAATVAALGYAFSAVFWSQAIIAEVYTLNTFFFFLLLWLVLEMAESEPQAFRRRLRIAALVYGLSLSNHWPLMLLSTPALLLPLVPRWRELIRAVPSLIPWILLGLTPYLWMFYRSQVPGLPFAFHGSIENLEMLWAYVSRRIYASVDVSPAAGWADRLWFIGQTALDLARQFTWVGVPFVMIGLLAQFRRFSLPILAMIWAAFLASTLVLLLLLRFDADRLHWLVFRVYPLVAYGMAALWLGLGFREVRRRLEALPPDFSLRRVLPGLLAALLILAPLLIHSRVNDRSQYSWAESYARMVLESVEPKAVLFVDGDAMAGSVAYLNLVEGVRSDVTLFHPHGMLFSSRLFHPYSTPLDQHRPGLAKFIQETERPIYYPVSLGLALGAEDKGFLFRIRPDLSPNNSLISLDEAVLAQVPRLVEMESHQTDPWSIMESRWALARLVSLMDQVTLDTQDPRLLERLQPLVELATKDSYLTHLVRADNRLARGDPRRIPTIEAHLQAAEPLVGQAFLRTDEATLPISWGFLARLQGDEAAAQRWFQQALQLWNHPDNPASKLLTEEGKIHSMSETGLARQRGIPRPIPGGQENF